MSRRILAIMNPISGRSGTRSVVREVARLVEREGGRLDVVETVCAGHATELASQVGPHVDAVLAVGGDGTVSEVVNGLFGGRVPMLILGAGTENLLARELAMPTTPRHVADTLLHGRPFPFDVGVLNGRRFHSVAGIGLDAECVLRLDRARRGHITRASYFWPTWRTFWTYRFPPLRVEGDGVCIFDDRGLVLIGVTGRYAAGTRMFAQARYDDGLLDVCAMPCTNRRQLLAHAARVFLRRHMDRGGVVYRQCRRVRVTSPDTVPIEIDGEVGGFLPADCTILPAAVRFLRLPSNDRDGGRRFPGS